jgi:hypothetical protein
MGKKFLNFLVVFMLLFSVGCQKDFGNNENDTSLSESQVIKEMLPRQNDGDFYGLRNELELFLKKNGNALTISKELGMPVWNKNLDFESSKGIIHIIPLLKQTKVQGFIKIQKTLNKGYEFIIKKRSTEGERNLSSIQSSNNSVFIDYLNFKVTGENKYSLSRNNKEEITSKPRKGVSNHYFKFNDKNKSTNKSTNQTANRLECMTYMITIDIWYDPDGDADPCDCSGNETYAYSINIPNTVCWDTGSGGSTGGGSTGGGGDNGGGANFPDWKTYEFKAEDYLILEQERLEIEEADMIRANQASTPCTGTKRVGNSRWPGTIEHWLIEYDFVSSGFRPGAMREYSIPQAGSGGLRTGYADIVDFYTGEIFEIKPNNLVIVGQIEAANYVAKAILNCPNPNGWRLGTNYTTRALINMARPNEMLVAELRANGVVGYRYEAYNPSAVPVALPAPMLDRIQRFLEDLLRNQHPYTYEKAILAFLRNNTDIAQHFKNSVIYAASAIIIGTLIEDILTAGAGILDDWACFVIASRFISIASKIP